MITFLPKRSGHASGLSAAKEFVFEPCIGSNLIIKVYFLKPLVVKPPIVVFSPDPREITIVPTIATNKIYPVIINQIE